MAEAAAGVPQPIRLILDDVHELVDPDALDGLQIFIRIKPATVQLVLSSRFDPPLSLPRLRLAGRLRELRAAQLAFTPAQTASCWSVGATTVTRGRSRCCTGGPAAGPPVCGWPRSRVAESADREAFLTQFSGDDHSVADYLVGEILSGLPEDLAGVPARDQHL